MEENFHNLVKEIHMQIQEAQRVPNKMGEKRPTPRQIIIKMPNFKDKQNIKSSKREAVTYLHRSSHKNVS